MSRFFTHAHTNAIFTSLTIAVFPLSSHTVFPCSQSLHYSALSQPAHVHCCVATALLNYSHQGHYSGKNSSPFTTTLRPVPANPSG